MKSLLLAIELALNTGFEPVETYHCIPTPITSILIFKLWLRGITTVETKGGSLLFAERRVKWWQISNDKVFHSLFIEGKMLFCRRTKRDVVDQILDKGFGVIVEDIAYSVMFEPGDMTLSLSHWYYSRKSYKAFYIVSYYIFAVTVAVILT